MSTLPRSARGAAPQDARPGVGGVRRESPRLGAAGRDRPAGAPAASWQATQARSDRAAAARPWRHPPAADDDELPFQSDAPGA